MTAPPPGWPPQPAGPWAGYAPPAYAAPYGAPQPFGAAPQPGAPVVQRPPTRLVLALIAVLLCLPLGWMALVLSTAVDRRWRAGDAAGAARASSRARLIAVIAVVVGVLAITAYVGGLALYAQSDG